MLNFQSEELKSKLLQSVVAQDLKLKTIFSQVNFQNEFLLVDTNEAFNGTLETNPFFFQHFNLSKMDVTCDGHSVYGKPFEPRFGND